VSFVTLSVLFVVALFVGVFNVVIGPTGGVMAGTTAALIPPPASLLLHAGVSWWSSLWRSITLRDRIDRQLLTKICAASIPTLVLFQLTTTRLSSSAWRYVIGLFLAAWALSPAWRKLLSNPRSASVAAAVAGAASATIGAGGAIVMPTIRSQVASLDDAIATEAALTVVQNSVKILLLLTVFEVSITAFFPHLVVMSTGASLGLHIGRRLSMRLREETRDRFFKATLLSVAVWLLLSG
jgi:uncharacterized membrane protein YfcA